MKKHFRASKAILIASILTSSLLSITFSTDSVAQTNSKPASNSVIQLHETHDLNELKNIAYNKMSKIDNPNAVDLADLHQVIFSKDKAQFHEFLVHANYDEIVNSEEYKASNPNAMDLADTMGNLEHYSDFQLIDAL